MHFSLILAVATALVAPAAAEDMSYEYYFRAISGMSAKGPYHDLSLKNVNGEEVFKEQNPGDYNPCANPMTRYWMESSCWSGQYIFYCEGDNYGNLNLCIAQPEPNGEKYQGEKSGGTSFGGATVVEQYCSGTFPTDKDCPVGSTFNIVKVDK